jgi:crotonobetainyl-CoA:carnitine CoA-transferase CaiB-like acyl-CoA transferase
MHNTESPGLNPPMTAKTQRGPLCQLKVIELGNFVAGPYCTRLLAEFGAEVIKIELPNEGDPIRKWRVLDDKGTSYWWYVQSRNKKCITLDCRQPEGLDILKSLVREADVLVENFRPGTLDSWGLTAKVLQDLNPKLVVARISGFGQDGPYRDRVSFGAIAEAMSGLRYITGYPDRPPTRVGISLGDSIAALYGVIGIVMALYHRDAKGGSGQEVDVALCESVFSLMESMVTEYDQKGVIRERSGSALPGIAPSNVYPTKDSGYVVIAANGDAIVRRLLKVIDREDLIHDEHWVTNVVRAKHSEEIDAVISGWTSSKPLKDCLDQLNAGGVPAARIYNVADIVHDPQYLARGMILEMQHPELGSVKVPGVVPKLSQTPGAVEWLGPAMGEHNIEVLKKIGLSESQIGAMQKKGII